MTDLIPTIDPADPQVVAVRKAHRPARGRRPRVLAIANQKGGVGKTTTAINLGTALAAIGEHVLIVDLDPQGNASTGLGIERKARRTSTYDVLTGQAPMRDAVIPTAVPQLYIAPVDHGPVRSRTRDRPAERSRLSAAHRAQQHQQRRADFRLHLRAGRLPAFAQSDHGQRDGGGAFDSGAAAMRVLRARRSVAIAEDGRRGKEDAQSDTVDPRHRADDVSTRATISPIRLSPTCASSWAARFTTR